MLNRLIAFSLQNRVIVVAAAALLLLVGGYTLANLPVDVLPDVNRPRVTVFLESGGLSPEEVETQVVFPIETALNGLPGVEVVRSNSTIGIGMVFVEFEWGQDIYRARQLVAEKVATVPMPPGIRPVLGPISSIMGQIMMVAVSADTTSAGTLRTLADFSIRRRLLSIKGVAQVIPMGGERVQYQVLISNERLRQYSLTVQDVDKALSAANANTTGGFFDRYGQEVIIRNIGRAYSLDDLAQTVVANRDQLPVLLSQVATVRLGPAVKRGDGSLNGKPAVLLTIEKQPGANTVAITQAVEQALVEMQPSLPPDVKLNGKIFQQKYFIDNSLHNVEEALLYGFALVVLVLVAFLLNVRVTAITLTAIPLSIVITGLVFKAFGVSINTLTLGGLAIAIGELVDDAIVDVENVYRRLRENAAKPAGVQLAPLRVVYLASAEVRNSIVYATVIVVLVFLPLFYLEGVEGKLFAPLGLAYITSIGASLLVSLTVTPALCSFLLSSIVSGETAAPLHPPGPLPPPLRGRKGEPDGAENSKFGVMENPSLPLFRDRKGEHNDTGRSNSEGMENSPLLPLRGGEGGPGGMRGAVIPTETSDSRLVRWLKAKDTALLERNLGRPVPILIGTGLLVIAALAAIPFLGTEFLPPFNEGSFTVNLSLPAGASLEESNRIGTLAERIILKIPEIESVARRTGRAELDEHVEPVSNSELDLLMRPNSGRGVKAVLADIRQRLSVLEGVQVEIGQPISHRLEHLMSGVRAQVAVKIFGPDLSRLRQLAKQTGEQLRGTPGAADVAVERQVQVPILQVQINRAALQRFGVQAGGLAETLETLLNGRVTSQIVKGQQYFDVLLRTEDRERSSVEAIENAQIPVSSGGTVPLRLLASVRYEQGPNLISHQNTQRTITVSANVQGRDLGSAVMEMQARVRQNVPMPQGYYTVFAGQYEAQQAATRLLALLSVFSLAGIFLVLYTHFKSARIVWQVMLNIPLALVGSVLAVVLTGGTFSIATLVGFITLTGIASRNGIMMIGHYIHLIEEEGETFSRQMIIRGSLERLAPVLMTALVAALALVPLTLNPEAAGKEILYPVAVVILGGLLSSTLLDIIVTPVLFYAVGEKALLQYAARRKAQQRLR